MGCEGSVSNDTRKVRLPTTCRKTAGTSLRRALSLRVLVHGSARFCSQLHYTPEVQRRGLAELHGVTSLLLLNAMIWWWSIGVIFWRGINLSGKLVVQPQYFFSNICPVRVVSLGHIVFAHAYRRHQFYSSTSTSVLEEMFTSGNVVRTLSLCCCGGRCDSCECDLTF